MSEAEKKWKDFADKKRVQWAWDNSFGEKKTPYYHLELIPAYKAALRREIEKLERKKETGTNFISTDDSSFNYAIDLVLQLLDTVEP